MRAHLRVLAGPTLCGVRSKSRTERVVDLHEAGTLEAVSAYVMHERPHDTMSPILFLVGGNGPRRHV